MSGPHDPEIVHGLSVQEISVLKDEVTKARGRAYCPYSSFPVGCSILLKRRSIKRASGEPLLRDDVLTDVVSGANVENAAYPAGICAERNALGAAVFQGARFGDVQAIFVTTNMEEACSPCGMCRQFIREFCEPQTPIFMLSISGEYVVKTLDELLPMSFGPESLGINPAQ